MPAPRHQGEKEYPEKDTRKEWPVRWKEYQKKKKTCPGSKEVVHCVMHS